MSGEAEMPNPTRGVLPQKWYPLVKGMACGKGHHLCGATFRHDLWPWWRITCEAYM